MPETLLRSRILEFPSAKAILKGVSLTIHAGSPSIMGPNVGQKQLANVLSAIQIRDYRRPHLL